MTGFKYQVYLYGSEAITYLNAFLWVVTEPASTMSHLTAPHPLLQAALPLFVWQHNLHPFGRQLWLNYHTMLKARGKPVWLRNHHM